ncbi:hypothetical protein [Acidovorax sp. SUPP3334]|uniref:hypothetical protein n=1 Tax=Acidovorax sp. SUPP3334 TaxID=2920881 RepID=UPI0023DE6A8E|nr:hypothetical protein [Acidovorax sp. SUPP3334]GKT26418.1 hypothetical protein AVHM3334_20945 [Acidovorax sp. SUPP3334]
MSSRVASAADLPPRALAPVLQQEGDGERSAAPGNGRAAVSVPAASTAPTWGALWSRGMHLLQPNVALLRAGARQLSLPVLWLGSQMQLHPERAALVVNALQQASSATGVPQRLETAADLLASGATALAQQLRERNDVDAAERIAEALVDLDAARLAGELLGEAIYGLLKQLPDRYVVGLQMFLGIGVVAAHWHLSHPSQPSQRSQGMPGPSTASPDASVATPGEAPRRRAATLDRVALASAVVALNHAGQGVLGDGYATGVAESLSGHVREALGQWRARARGAR